MRTPADLLRRTSSTDLADLPNSVTSRSSSKSLSSLLRRAALALSIPAALLVSAAVPTAQPVTVQPASVAASVDVAAGVAEGSLALGAPRSNALSSGTVAASALNMRSGPGTGYRIIATLARGTYGTVLSQSNGWYKISTSRGTGWVFGSYFRVGGTATVSAAAPASNIASIARSLVGRPYVYGATGPYAFDCSGFTQYVFRQAGISISRTTETQYYTRGTRIRSYSGLQAGDLVFFANTYKPGISHVGIYLGNGQMVHAGSSKTGVNITNINYAYWTSRFAGGIRAYR